jgi:predicted P-loop ATPase
LISAVARVYEQGVKVDCALIPEGEQGLMKSTALKALSEPWFTDEIADLGSKDAAMQTRGVWVIEIAELDSMSRAEVSKIKSFISRVTDRFRPPYGKRLIESPRQCVFAASVNHSTYLRDETGGRHFWPVTCYPHSH